MSSSNTQLQFLILKIWSLNESEAQLETYHFVAINHQPIFPRYHMIATDAIELIAFSHVVIQNRYCRQDKNSKIPSDLDMAPQNNFNRWALDFEYL